jgi:hypothetical protein
MVYAHLAPSHIAHTANIIDYGTGRELETPVIKLAR